MPGRAVDGVTPPERAGSPASEDLRLRRAGVDAYVGDAGAGVTVEDVDVAGVGCRIVGVPEPRATIVYLHGGGYRLGTAAAWTTTAGRIARAARARVVLVDYRLAPENPYPAGLRDAATVYDEIVAHATHPVFVAGDSSGGGLAAGLVNAAISANAAPPAGVVLLSPWLDLRGDWSTRSPRARLDQVFPPEQAAAAAALYLQGHPGEDPIASPLLGVAAGFPPTIVFVSTDELLLDDALGLAQRLAGVGTPFSLEVVTGMPHAWLSVSPEHVTSAATVERVGQFVHDVLARSGGD